ncbi:MAG: glycine cleavage system protein R [Planctomycetes bacterium]|nr:glycine cleavage system protein R [Planctomycetota bacterium]
MKTFLVITVTSPDHPGIVERVTRVLVEHGANWEESRMARLGGDFAGIVKVSVAAEKAEPLQAALEALSDEQITVTVKTTQPDAPEQPAEGRVYELRLTGADHEGIVHKVTAYLAGRGVNVETMETDVRPAPVSGTPLFYMQAQMKVPLSLPLSELQADLADVGHELGVDIEIAPVTDDATARP